MDRQQQPCPLCLLITLNCKRGLSSVFHSCSVSVVLTHLPLVFPILTETNTHLPRGKSVSSNSSVRVTTKQKFSTTSFLRAVE